MKSLPSLSMFVAGCFALAGAAPPTRIQPRTSPTAVNPNQVANWPERIAARDAGSEGEAWAQATLDDGAWKTMKLPVHFEKAGLPDFDGVVWFRRMIEIPVEMTKAAAVLSLGAIDDMDVTWVNGVRVGGYEQPGAHFTPRNYKLPTGTLKPGKNLIAVRVMDHGQGGGMAATHGNMQLTAGGKTIPLAGKWHYRAGATLAQLLSEGDKEVITSPSIEPFKGKFGLRPHEVISFAGGTTMVKQAESGYLEAILTNSTGEAVHFRDIAWQADTVYQQQRPRNFGTHLDLLERAKTSMIIANFGQMEALDGTTEMPRFIAAYEQLLDQYSQCTSRIVLIAPHRYAKPENPHLPDLSKRNGDLDAYAGGIRQLAERRGFLFVDLAKLDLEGLSPNGVQLNDAGHYRWAQLVASELTGQNIRGQAPALDEMRTVIKRKNKLWQQHWRPTNWSFLYGNRQHVPSSHDHRPGKPRWLPEEVNAIIPLIEHSEAEILSQQLKAR